MSVSTQGKVAARKHKTRCTCLLLNTTKADTDNLDIEGQITTKHPAIIPKSLKSWIRFSMLGRMWSA